MSYGWLTEASIIPKKDRELLGSSDKVIFLEIVGLTQILEIILFAYCFSNLYCN